MLEQHDGDEEAAKKICGAMQRDMEGSVEEKLIAQQKVMSFEDNGKLFMKIFLIDGSVNQNSWGVKSESIPTHINSAIGKPVVMFKNALGQFDHPALGDKDLSHALAYQDLFRVGTFIDVQEDRHKPGTWWGIAEITDDDFKKAVKEDPTIPFYVSPTIALSSPFQNDQQITDWTFMHSAIVDRPAFGIHKAYIGSHCNGDQKTCLLQLRKASIEKHGLGCGFCKYKAAKQLQATIKSSGNIKTVSSYDSNKQVNKVVTSRLTEDNNASNNKSEVVSNTSTEVKTEQPKVESVKTTVEQQPINKSDSNNTTNTQQANIPLEEYQRALTKVKEYELKLQSMSADKDSLQAIVGKLNDEVGKLKEKAEMEAREARHNTITELVSRSAVYQGLSDADKQKQVENFEKSSFTLDDIKGVLGPIEQNFKKASLDRQMGGASYGSRLQLGPNKSISGVASTNIETKSASSSTGNTERKIPEWLESMQVQFQDGGA